LWRGTTGSGGVTKQKGRGFNPCWLYPGVKRLRHLGHLRKKGTSESISGEDEFELISKKLRKEKTVLPNKTEELQVRSSINSFT